MSDAIRTRQDETKQDEKGMVLVLNLNLNIFHRKKKNWNKRNTEKNEEAIIQV